MKRGQNVSFTVEVKMWLRCTYDKCFERQDVASYVYFGNSWGRLHHLVTQHTGLLVECFDTRKSVWFKWQLTPFYRTGAMCKCWCRQFDMTICFNICCWQRAIINAQGTTEQCALDTHHLKLTRCFGEFHARMTMIQLCVFVSVCVCVFVCVFVCDFLLAALM